MVIILRAKSTNIGDIGESKAILEFTKLEIPVSKPLSSNVSYDLIIDCLGTLYKVQVKTCSSVKDGKICTNICQNNAFTGTHWCYDEKDVDLFFIYCIETDTCCLLRYSDVVGCKSITLRPLSNKPLNNQLQGVRFIEDYSIEKTLSNMGYSIV